MIELAADRSPYICQGQSVNVFIPGDVDKWDLHMLHWSAWEKGVNSRPFLHCFLALDGCIYIVIAIVPNEHGDAIPLGETVERSLLMVPDSAFEIRGHANIKRAVARTRHDINEIVFRHGIELALAGLPEQVRQ